MSSLQILGRAWASGPAQVSGQEETRAKQDQYLGLACADPTRPKSTKREPVSQIGGLSHKRRPQRGTVHGRIQDSSDALRLVRTAFTRACQRANFFDVTPHILRQVLASRLGLAGKTP